MKRKCIAAAEERLLREGLPEDAVPGLARVAVRLAERFDADHPGATGLAGPPGTGKSTLAGAMVAALDARGVTAFVLSLDDYYLGAEQRARLARRVHPLFRHRGVPGTHDIAALVGDLDALLAGRLQRLQLPRFDKARDDRAPTPRPRPSRAPKVVVVEGWIVGVPPQAPAALATPVNDWEARLDPEGTWRRAVHQHHVQDFRTLAPRLGTRSFLDAPGWDAVIRWRAEQEARLARPALRDRAAIEAFLAPFERLVRHAHEGCRNWADTVISLDEAHHVRAAAQRGAEDSTE